MKILIMPSKVDEIPKYKDCNGFIIGLEKMSVMTPLQVSIEEIKKISLELKQSKKELFVSINKLMYNKDIPLLKEYLLILEGINIKGIIFDDLAVFNMAKSLKIRTPLVYFGVHFLTNQYTSNFWYEKGVKYGILSTEITLDHIQEICSNTKMTTMMYGYGYLPMFVSSRPLISSYFKHIGKTYEPKLYNMYEEQRKKMYPTYESEDGTVILSSDVINIICELPTLSTSVDYVILSSLNIEENRFFNVYNYYVEALSHLEDKDKLCEISKKVSDQMQGKTDKGFLYKETVYRVKNNEK